MSKIAGKVGIPLLLVSASLGFCFLILELGLRLIGFDRLAAIEEGRDLLLRASEHPERHYEFTPNASGYAWHTHVRINSHGMRDREYPVARSEASRVVVLGDSVTFGSGVSSKDRFSERLEVGLEERLGRRVEVLNLAVGGYDALQEVATLEHVGLRFAPDLVVVAYCVNDIADTSPNLDYIESLRNAGSRLYRLRTAQLLRVLRDHWMLMRRLERDNQDDRYAARFQGKIAPVPDDPELTVLRETLRARFREEEPDFLLERYLSDVHLGKLEFALGRLEQLEREHGLEVIVAVLPFFAEDARYEVVYRIVEQMARAHGFETLVLKHRLAIPSGGLESLRIWERDPIHPNALGHRLIAEALEPTIAARLGQRGATRTPTAPGSSRAGR